MKDFHTTKLLGKPYSYEAFKVGEKVSWQGQSRKFTRTIKKITEPQPGNQVLHFYDGFAINSADATRV